MKLIDRNKFFRFGFCDSYRNIDKSDPEYGLVYNCDRNKSMMNYLEFIYFNAEFEGHKKANILWTILYLLCPFYHQYKYIFYTHIKRYGFSSLFEMSIAEFFSLLIITAIVLCGLGPLWSILIWWTVTRKAKKIVKRAL